MENPTQFDVPTDLGMPMVVYAHCCDIRRLLFSVGELKNAHTVILHAEQPAKPGYVALRIEVPPELRQELDGAWVGVLPKKGGAE